MKEEDFKSYEYYSIEEHNGEKEMHIFGYVWKNDGREDDDGNLAPYTVTEYTGVYIPVGELVACRTPEERWDLIMDYECACSQYEGDYTWEGLLDAGWGSPDMGNGIISTGEPYSANDYLHYSDIWFDTPCGDYWYEG